MTDDQKKTEPPFPFADGGSTNGIGHLLARVDCPHCGAPADEHYVANYSEIWRDGDVMCRRCGNRVRGYDAG